MRLMSVGRALLLLVALSSVPVHSAAAPPDSLAAAELRLAIRQRPCVRVSSRWGAARLIKPRVVPGGLEFSAARPDEPGTEVGSIPNPIPIAQVYTAEVPVSGALVGALLGALAGVVVGVIAEESISNLSGIMSASGPKHPSAGELAQGAVVCAVPGMALGALIGSFFRDMKRVYPQATALDGGVR